jgi:hypothetical protein
MFLTAQKHRLGVYGAISRGYDEEKIFVVLWFRWW